MSETASCRFDPAMATLLEAAGSRFYYGVAILLNLGEAVEGCLAVEVLAECWTTTGAAPLTLSD